MQIWLPLLIASFIRSGINGNEQAVIDNQTAQIQIASFIRSGINGNNKGTDLGRIETAIASFIRSGINGNTLVILFSNLSAGLIASFIRSGINGNVLAVGNNSKQDYHHRFFYKKWN